MRSRRKKEKGFLPVRVCLLGCQVARLQGVVARGTWGRRGAPFFLFGRRKTGRGVEGKGRRVEGGPPVQAWGTTREGGF
jgi:hypothetical protein